MDEKKWGALLAAGVLLLAAGGYYLHQNKPPVVASEPEPAPVAPATPAPAPDYPVPAAQPDAPPLPALTDSDEAFRTSLDDVLGAAPVEAFLIPDMLIRRVVATVDNLPRDRVALKLRPVKRTAGEFLVKRDDGRITLSADNAARYAPLFAVIRAVDASRLVALYFRYYPLFQKAYQELGYPDRSFNNRLVEAIDNLLATPEPPGEIELVQPKVIYEYADANLEARSAGQKTLLRLSTEQRAAIKQQLGRVRALIVAAKP